MGRDRGGEVVTVQVDVEVAVRELVPDPMCPGDREGGLPDASRPVDSRDHRCPPGTVTVVRQQAVQVAEVLLSPGEVRDSRRELPGYPPFPGRPGLFPRGEGLPRSRQRLCDL